MVWLKISRASRVKLAALLVLAGSLSAFLLESGAGAQPRAHAAASGHAFAVVLPAPAAGDVTYGVAEVRIGSHLRLPAGLGRQQTVFAQRIAGLSVVARSAQWRSLRATTRVYLVASTVVGGSTSTRDVAFFIVRRVSGSRRARAAKGAITVTIANAHPVIGSFFVRGVNASGYADIFAVRDILTTALDNWSRYIAALKLAHALAAAVRARDRSSRHLADGASARRGRGGTWTGGQRPDALLVAVYHLVVGSIVDPSRYAAVKKNPLVVEFIADELRNPALARRWQAVTAQVPLQVPDKYAAAAQEEARFMKGRPRHVSARAAQSSCPTGTSQAPGGCDCPQNQFATPQLEANSSSVAGCGTPGNTLTLTVVKSGTGTGTVTDHAFGAGGVQCGAVCSETGTWAQGYPLGGDGLAELSAVPDTGSVFTGWSVSPADATPCSPTAVVLNVLNGCDLLYDQNITVTATFAKTSFLLAVFPNGSGSGTVTSQPAGIDCGSTCGANFPAGEKVTLTAVAAPGSEFSSWGSLLSGAGCDSVSANSCLVTMNTAEEITATFTASPSPQTTWSSTSTPTAALTNSSGTASSYLGVSLALSADGTTAVVGAEGVNGSVGAAYIFHVSSEGSWSSSSTPTATLTNHLGAANDYFGDSVALSADGTTAVIASQGATNGGVYVFHVSSENSWSSRSTPTAFLSTGGRATGVAISSDGSTVLVLNNTANSAAGAAYIFHASSESAWTSSSSPTATLTNGGGGANDNFGYSGALSSDGTTAVIGAYNANAQKGAAYIFHVSSEGSWSSSSTPTATLTNAAGTTSDDFGFSVSIAGDGSTALVGAYGVNNTTGAAYIFHVSSEGSWLSSSTPTATLTNGAGAQGDALGDSVYLSNDGTIALIGAAGVNNSTGAEYIFQAPTESSWSSTSTPTATVTNGGQSFDYFGSAAGVLSSDDTTALMSAFGTHTNTGTAYIFRASP